MSESDAREGELLGLSGWRWTADPVSWQAGGNALSWRCQPESDLWRLTASGVVKDDANALVIEAAGDFSLSGRFEAEFGDCYDQVGLLVYESAEHWLKAGAEWTDELLVGAVHTRGHSDWSMAAGSLPAWLEVRRSGGTVEVAAGPPGETPRLIRQLHMDGPVRVGPYACSPSGPGFVATATELSLQLGGTAG